MIVGAIIGLIILTIVYFLALRFIIKGLMNNGIRDGFLLIVGIGAIVTGTVGITVLWVLVLKQSL